jgi:hypothetical protein
MVFKEINATFPTIVCDLSQTRYHARQKFAFLCFLLSVPHIVSHSLNHHVPGSGRNVFATKISTKDW